MLPVVICDPDAGARAKWMSLLDEVVRAEYRDLV